MKKTRLKPRPYMYPKPAVLVGSMVRGKPNFMTIANCGIINYDPPMIYVASNRRHLTNSGIRRRKTFSVNVPNSGMAAVTDYCGIRSGRDVDKSEIFEVFTGELKTAPLIAECPVSFECRLVRTIRMGEEEVFVGEIAAIHVDNGCMTDGKPDIKKIDPLIYSTSDRKYFSLGKEIAPAYSVGKKFSGK